MFQMRLSSICDLCLQSGCRECSYLGPSPVRKDSDLMLHFSCDLCGHHLDDRRYVVKVEVFPAFDPDEIVEEELDTDHLAEVAEMIQEMEATGNTELEDY